MRALAEAHARAALEYAAAGWPVFPLRANKTPAFGSPHPRNSLERVTCRGTCGKLGHAFYDATTDAGTVRAWFTDPPPGTLIAARVPEHLVVLDVDPRGGGEDTLGKLQQNGPLPDTLTCYSGRGDGGRHLYYTRPPGKLVGRLGPGVDVCHHGLRYVVVPPSIHRMTGKPYRWDDPGHPVAQPPVWLVALLRSKPRRRVTGASNGSTSGHGLVRFVERHNPGDGTGRHDAVLWALCCAYQDGCAADVVDEIKAAAVRIGKPEGEVDSMAAWAEANAGGAR